MPTVSVDQERFFAALDEPQMTIPQFEDLCFDFGVELDEVTSEREMAMKETKKLNEASLMSDRVILKIDVSADRYDLLCFEGLVKSMRIFQGKQEPPQFSTLLPKLQIVVEKDCVDVRPFVVCAVLRDFTFTPQNYASFIDMQEKLHSGLCRRRSKVAIGTHDLDKIQAPFVYKAQKPDDIVFKPLNRGQEPEVNADQLFKLYEEHDKRLAKFLPLIQGKPRYPVIRDAKQRVLSLPPIINSDFSKITLETKNIFIECTATDLTKAQQVLNIFSTTFSCYCKIPYQIEQVEVVYEQKPGQTNVYPDLTPQSIAASVQFINSSVGVGKLTNENIVQLLTKMGLMSQPSANGKMIDVKVPAYRTDILHECDIMEDVAVAFGINKIPRTMPNTVTIGASFPLNKLTDMIRQECAMCSWTEVLTLTLCSHDENFAFLGKVDSKKEAVMLLNPATAEYQVVRTSLLPGMLKTLQANKKTALPIKIFECADVVLQDELSDRCASNSRRLCAVFCSKTSGFEQVHGLLDRVMLMLSIPFVTLDQQSLSTFAYSIRESSWPQYFIGRQAEIVFKGAVVGCFGIVAPVVLSHFDLAYPCSSLELNIQPFL